jgi:hypothetical protein
MEFLKGEVDMWGKIMGYFVIYCQDTKMPKMSNLGHICRNLLSRIRAVHLSFISRSSPVQDADIVIYR